MLPADITEAGTIVFVAGVSTKPKERQIRWAVSTLELVSITAGSSRRYATQSCNCTKPAHTFTKQPLHKIVRDNWPFHSFRTSDEKKHQGTSRYYPANLSW